MKRYIETLTLEEILALAIKVEENNAERLKILSEGYTDYNPELNNFFESMRKEELLHRKVLLDLWVKKYGDKLRPDVNEIEIKGVIEAVDVDHGEHFLFDDLNIDKAIELVHQAETQAYTFYLKAAATVDDMDIKTLFSRLASYEYEHMNNIAEY
jgi:rubrerythrin